MPVAVTLGARYPPHNPHLIGKCRFLNSFDDDDDDELFFVLFFFFSSLARVSAAVILRVSNSKVRGS